MSQKPETTSLQSQALPSSQNASHRSTKVDPLARRRLLLSGLGKGAAVIGAAVPLQTLASSVLVCNGSSGKNGLCTVSGFQSAMHSFGGGGTVTQVQARGWSAAKWGEGQTFNEGPANPWPIPEDTLFRSVFGGNSTATLYEVVQTNTTNAHWVAAYLNGIKYYPTSFPYPAITNGGVTGVREWYFHPQSAQALSLFMQLEANF